MTRPIVICEIGDVVVASFTGRPIVTRIGRLGTADHGAVAKAAKASLAD
jgi:hypothetical protein